MLPSYSCAMGIWEVGLIYHILPRLWLKKVTIYRDKIVLLVLVQCLTFVPLGGSGFVCVAAEFPESLAASYDRVDGLDRKKIMSQLLDDIGKKWQINPSSYGIVGHSLGCGTALATGDASWSRVCIAGFLKRRDGTRVEGNVLSILSTNDGTAKFSGFRGVEDVPTDMAVLDLNNLPSNIPPRSALVMEKPNHISFLADGVNNAMIDLLSPLLPVAQALSIPVLDFDKYKESRDSDETAEVIIPLVKKYLKQQMAT